jgi:TRAP-type C4-dicarboxylate transport system permease small subunit
MQAVPGAVGVLAEGNPTMSESLMRSSGQAVAAAEMTPLERIAYQVNWVLERVCAALAAAMVLIVWFGVFERYVVSAGQTWTEELARFVMIWGALLGVPCAAYYREHIGLEMFLGVLPLKPRKVLILILDIISVAFFLFMTYYGILLTRDGATAYATIFSMTMVIPFASVPVSSAFAAFQFFVAMLRMQRQLKAQIASGGVA